MMVLDTVATKHGSRPQSERHPFSSSLSSDQVTSIFASSDASEIITMNAATQSSERMSQPSRIAALLGFENAGEMDDVALADRVAAGLGVGAATSLSSALEPMVDVVGGIIPEATFRRVRKARKPLSREMSERLYEVGRVLEVARQSYAGDDAAAKTFLTRSHPLLGGRTPLDLAQRSSAGADAVVNLLRRAEAGFSV